MEKFNIGDIEVRLRRTEGRVYSYRTLRVAHALVFNAPYYIPMEKVKERAAEYVATAKAQGKFNDLTDGGYMLVLGEKLPLRMYNADECSIACVNETVYLGVVGGRVGYHARKVINNFYVKKLTEYLKERLPEIENYLGLKCSGWRVSSIYSAWGICNPGTKKINFSVNLATKSKDFIDAVVAHELTHIKFPDHGEDFYNFLKFYVPDYAKIIKK